MSFFHYLRHKWSSKSAFSPVRYFFSMSAIFLAAVGATAILSQTDSHLVLESSRSVVTTGERFYVDIYLDAKQPVNAVDIELSFPSHRLEVEGVDVGRSVITLWTEQPYVENGSIYLRGGTYRRGFIGRHLIATVQLQAVSMGTVNINTEKVNLFAGDGTGRDVEAVDVGKESVTVIVHDKDFVPKSIAEGTVLGDLDGDGVVTLKDISIFMSAWHDGSAVYDFTGDGKMTFRDFGILLSMYFFQR